MIGAIVFLSELRQVQTSTVFLVLLVALCESQRPAPRPSFSTKLTLPVTTDLHLFYRPYDLDEESGEYDLDVVERAKKAEMLERYSLSALLLTYLSSFYFNGELERDGVVATSLGWAVVAINLVYLVLFAYECGFCRDI